MQAVQEAIVLAGAAQLTAEHPGLLLDRTERLACSLGRMVGVVEQLNALPHEFQILLMAGGCPVMQAIKASCLLITHKLMCHMSNTTDWAAAAKMLLLALVVTCAPLGSTVLCCVR